LCRASLDADEGFPVGKGVAEQTPAAQPSRPRQALPEALCLREREERARVHDHPPPLVSRAPRSEIRGAAPPVAAKPQSAVAKRGRTRLASTRQTHDRMALATVGTVDKTRPTAGSFRTA
jgi:hypothetical protein